MARPIELCLALAVVGGCVGVRPDAPPPDGNAAGPGIGGGEDTGSRPSRALVAFEAGDLRVTSGAVESEAPGRFSNRSPTLRAWLGNTPRSAAELDFVYRGPTAESAPLASGELRRQIGLELRARDTCNVVYVMWHIEPSPGIVVSVKSNPSQSRHAECRDRGYSFLQPITSEVAPLVAPGQPHVLAAAIRGRRLHVSTDGRESWVGELPVAAFEFDGPVGVRSDNADFSAALRAEELVP
ncbi:MAG TPA: hypothetical protein VMG12_41350 [Polyangiaceae bacterium]|nr:hypothetical protein [Polyangiaceae bacterium]